MLHLSYIVTPLAPYNAFVILHLLGNLDLLIKSLIIFMAILAIITILLVWIVVWTTEQLYYALERFLGSVLALRAIVIVQQYQDL